MIAKMLVKNMKKFRQPLLQASVSLISNRNNIAVLNFSRNVREKKITLKRQIPSNKMPQKPIAFCSQKREERKPEEQKKKK